MWWCCVIPGKLSVKSLTFAWYLWADPVADDASGGLIDVVGAGCERRCQPLAADAQLGRAEEQANHVLVQNAQLALQRTSDACFTPSTQSTQCCRGCWSVDLHQVVEQQFTPNHVATDADPTYWSYSSRESQALHHDQRIAKVSTSARWQELIVLTTCASCEHQSWRLQRSKQGRFSSERYTKASFAFVDVLITHYYKTLRS